MNNDPLVELIAQRAAEILLEKMETGSDPREYAPTRRLSRMEAARHLGVSVRTLDGRVKSGEIWKYHPDGQKPYYLLGELDGTLPPGSMRKSASGVIARAAARTKRPFPAAEL